MADGWLCVSTLKQTSWSPSKRRRRRCRVKTLTQPVERRELPGGAQDGLLEQVVDRRPLEIDPRLEGLVRAVLAPGLGQRLELAVGRIAAEPGEVVLDRPHLGQAQRELARPAQIDERASSSAPSGTSTRWNVYAWPWPRWSSVKGADDGLLDGVVGQHAAGSGGQSGGRPVDAIGPDRPDVLDVVAEVATARRTLRLGVGHARLGQDVDDRVPTAAAGLARGRTRRSRRRGRPGPDGGMAEVVREQVPPPGSPGWPRSSRARHSALAGLQANRPPTWSA